MGFVSKVWLSIRLLTLWPLLQPHSIRSVSWGAQRCLQPLCSMHRPRHPLASWRHVSGRGFPVCLSRTHFTLHSLRSAYSWPPLHPFPLKEPQPLCVSASNTGAIPQACILGRIPDSTMICPLPIASTSSDAQTKALLQGPVLSLLGNGQRVGPCSCLTTDQWLDFGQITNPPKPHFPHLYVEITRRASPGGCENEQSNVAIPYLSVSSGPRWKTLESG